jgi:hypothetical protein
LIAITPPSLHCSRSSACTTETHDAARISSPLVGSVLLVIPSLALFLALPLFIRFGWGFWISLLAAIGLTAACYAALFLAVAQARDTDLAGPGFAAQDLPDGSCIQMNRCGRGATSKRRRRGLYNVRAVMVRSCH